jgi:hypothetical protein
VPKQKQTHYFVSGSGEPPLGKVQWQKIEKAYDKPLSLGVRRAIRSATQAYLLFAQLEERQPLSSAQKRMTRLSRLAKAFHEALQRDNPPSDDVFFVDYLIAKHLDRGDNLGPVEGLMASFVRACDLAGNEIKRHADSKLSRRRRGVAWGAWIRKLAAIATDSELHSDPGQNVVFGEPTPPTTPFAVLVSVLQQSLPEGYERTKHSDTRGAFIQALHRALREEI